MLVLLHKCKHSCHGQQQKFLEFHGKFITFVPDSYAEKQLMNDNNNNDNHFECCVINGTKLTAIHEIQNDKSGWNCGNHNLHDSMNFHNNLVFN